MTGQVPIDYEARMTVARAMLDLALAGGAPVHHREAVLAASVAVSDLMGRMAAAMALADPGSELRLRALPPGGKRMEMSVRVLAALLHPKMRCCPHLAVPQPVIVRLALYRADCLRCSQTQRRPPPEDDDRCDLCGAHGVEWFTPVSLQVGPLMAVGDVCGDCARAVGWDGA